MARTTLADFDHPVVFLFFLILAIVPIIALLGIVMARLGLPGPAALFGVANNS